MEEPTPTSAWQPPSAPDRVALCLHKYPIAAAARKPFRIFSFGALTSWRDFTTAGMIPAEPAVGAVTIMWPRAFSSPIANPYEATLVTARPASPLVLLLKLRCIAAALLGSLIGPGRTLSV